MQKKLFNKKLQIKQRPLQARQNQGKMKLQFVKIANLTQLKKYCIINNVKNKIKNERKKT